MKEKIPPKSRFISCSDKAAFQGVLFNIGADMNGV